MIAGVTLVDLDSEVELDVEAPLDTMDVNGEGVGINPKVVVAGVAFSTEFPAGLGVGPRPVYTYPVGLGVGSSPVFPDGLGVGFSRVFPAGLGVGDESGPFPGLGVGVRSGPCLGLGVGFSFVVPVGLGVGLIPSSNPAKESSPGQMTCILFSVGDASNFLTIKLLFFLFSKPKRPVYA